MNILEFLILILVIFIIGSIYSIGYENNKIITGNKLQNKCLQGKCNNHEIKVYCEKFQLSSPIDCYMNLIRIKESLNK